MSRYVVLEPPGVPGEDATAARPAADPMAGDAAVFVRDGFSVWAFLFTFLWLFRCRLWLAGLLALACVIGFALLDGVEGFGPASAVLEILTGMLVALEGPSLRIAKLRRQGWQETAAFEADDRDEAEIIYYAGKTSPRFAEEDAPPSHEPMAGADMTAASASTAENAPRHDRFFDAMRAR